jgi:hypothetical protein
VLVPLTGVMEGVYVQRQQRITRTRNTSRDGLEALHGAGVLNGLQRTAGIGYRRMDEELSDGLGSQFGSFEGGRAGSAGHDAISPDEPEMPKGLRQRAMQRERFDGLERRVRARTSNGDLSLFALRAIAGKGQNLNELASDARRRAAIRAALVEALDVVADILGIH